MSAAAADWVTLAVIALGGLVVPWAAMLLIVPALERSGSGRVKNYCGRDVIVGLGIVWVVWTVGMMGAGRVLELFDWMLPAGGNQPYSELPMAVPFVLVLGAFAFGFVDDVFGTPGDRGFRGHVRALWSGRLTTGGLKLLGIGLLAAVSVRADSIGQASYEVVVSWALAVLAIALTANLVNLLDLRPGRALKAYGVAAGACALSLAVAGQTIFGAEVALALLGPVVAVWRFDLGERAMLGDAGANAMGALLGWVFASILPPWGLAIYVAIVLALNITSERISFSRVIERNAALSWIDGLGRLSSASGPAGAPAPLPAATTARSAPDAGDSVLGTPDSVTSAKTSHHPETNDG